MKTKEPDLFPKAAGLLDLTEEVKRGPVFTKDDDNEDGWSISSPKEVKTNFSVPPALKPRPNALPASTL